jgi:hypothetical protein
VSDSDGLPRLSVGVTALAVAALAVLVGPEPAPLGVLAVGTLLLAVGLRRKREAWLALGGATLLAGVVLAGLDGRSTGWFLAAATAAVLAWTSGRYAVRLARQVGRAGTTHRVELVHTISTVTVLGVGGGTGYLVSRSVTGGSSPLVLALLLVAAVAFTVALRE